MTYEEIELINKLEMIKYDLTEKWLRTHYKKEENTEGYVYLIKCADKYKIGYTKDVERRLKELDTRPFPSELIVDVFSPIAFPIEQKIHALLSNHRVVGEWYSFETEINAFSFENFVDYVEIQMLKWG